MLNLLRVFYALAEKINLSKVTIPAETNVTANQSNTLKVDIRYPFLERSRVSLQDQARLKMDEAEAREFQKSIGTLPSFGPQAESGRAWTGEEVEVNFHSECLFLTIHAQRLGINPAFRKHDRRLQAIRQFESQIKVPTPVPIPSRPFDSRIGLPEAGGGPFCEQQPRHPAADPGCQNGAEGKGCPGNGSGRGRREGAAPARGQVDGGGVAVGRGAAGPGAGVRGPPAGAPLLPPPQGRRPPAARNRGPAPLPGPPRVLHGGPPRPPPLPRKDPAPGIPTTPAPSHGWKTGGG